MDAPTVTFGSTATYSCDADTPSRGHHAHLSGGYDVERRGADLRHRRLHDGTGRRPANGASSGTATTFGSVVSYTCNTGYTLSGAASVMCEASGSWSDVAPTCVINSCPTLTPPTDGGVSSTTGDFGDTVTYSCDSGFTLNGNIVAHLPIRQHLVGYGSHV